MTKFIKMFIRASIFIAIIWIGLTFFVQYSVLDFELDIGFNNNKKKILVLFNPDPIYNLDEQICTSFAKGLDSLKFNSKIISVNHYLESYDFDVYVFCANTYNWAPDCAITKFITSHKDIVGKKCIAITLGSGSTSRAKKIFEETIKESKGNLIASKEFWLLKPNDESRLDESNVDVAIEMAYNWAIKIGETLKNKN